MNIRKTLLAASLTLAATAPAFAGGLLTNTNQNIAFLRNMARDAAIGIDGVYSNPAGVVFLGEGFHLSLNMQNAHQTRNIETSVPAFFINNYNNSAPTHYFKGTSDAPVIPSVQAAWNKGKWSYQFNFAITGGGGKCEFDDGLGSFETVVGGGLVGLMPQANGLYKKLSAAGVPGMAGHEIGPRYAYDSYMRGRQYYFGFTWGAAYKVNDNLSLYGGLRLLYGTSNYYGYVKNIQVEHKTNSEPTTMVNASQHFDALRDDLMYQAGAMAGKAELASQMGQAAMAGQFLAGSEQLKQAATAMATASVQTGDIELNCDQKGFGFAPIIGIDYRLGALNLAAKYEFKTRMRLKNKSANSESAAGIAMLEQFKDGKKVSQDTPALLAVGAQYSVCPAVRVMAGWHHYFDQDTPQYTKEMLDDTNEYTFGAEWDVCKLVTVSAGAQRTEYGCKDAMMNDISFNCNSWMFGAGVELHLTDKINVNLGYMENSYDDRTVETPISAAATKTDTYSRTNRVLGVGVDFKF